jgi:hypothetical protein
LVTQKPKKKKKEKRKKKKILKKELYPLYSIDRRFLHNLNTTMSYYNMMKQEYTSLMIVILLVTIVSFKKEFDLVHVLYEKETNICSLFLLFILFGDDHDVSSINTFWCLNLGKFIYAAVCGLFLFFP